MKRHEKLTIALLVVHIVLTLATLVLEGKKGTSNSELIQVHSSPRCGVAETEPKTQGEPKKEEPFVEKSN